jgi:hypothetical protein
VSYVCGRPAASPNLESWLRAEWIETVNRSDYQIADILSSDPQATHSYYLYGKPDGPVTVVVGYQPYYTQSWSGVVMRGKKFYEKYLPKGSHVEFQTGLHGSTIVNNMLAGKQHIGSPCAQT